MIWHNNISIKLDTIFDIYLKAGEILPRRRDITINFLMISWCWNPPHVELWRASDNNVKANWFVLFPSATLDVVQAKNWAKSPSGLFKFVKSLSIHPSLQPITHLLWNARSRTPSLLQDAKSTCVCVRVCARVLQGDSNWSLTNARWESVSAAAGLAEVRGHWRKSTRVPCRAGAASSISVTGSAKSAHTHSHTQA